MNETFLTEQDDVEVGDLYGLYFNGTDYGIVEIVDILNPTYVYVRNVNNGGTRYTLTENLYWLQ